MRRTRIILGATLCLLSLSSRADEGMWLINDLRSDAREAVVAIDFFGTGSVISPQGLVITNHHVAYSDICALSTPERNILKDGFWAGELEREIPVPGRKMFFLKEFRDITDEVLHFSDSLAQAGEKIGSRKLAYLIEKKYSEQTGLEASLSSMWAGSRFYLSLYEVYSDIRLVAAPPESIGSFGGDTDNWQWPQHKCDFALYRIYAAPDGSPAGYSAQNIPLSTPKHLTVSTDGYRLNDRTTVIGYPGRTDRYSSAAETAYRQDLILPIDNEARERQLEILKRWMAADESVKLKYSDAFFSLSNVAECEQGEQMCLRRYGIVKKKLASEKELEKWLGSGDLTDSLDLLYSRTAFVERNKAWFRETMFRGPMIWRTIMRVANSKDFDKAQKFIRKGLEETDPRVEKELVNLAVQQYYTHVDSSFWGPYQKELAREFGTDYAALTDRIWDGSVFSGHGAHPVSMEEILSDPLLRFQQDVKITAFNERDDNLRKRGEIARLSRDYTRALYRMNASRGRKQYPDANSTMRYTTGKVCRLEPWDAVQYDWKSTAAGIVEKNLTGRPEYSLPEDYAALVGGCQVPVNFLTDNDITGGNSGSPVLDRRGRIIGLAFDGNTESLDSGMYYTARYNRCVCVDIRYVLWVLDKYAGMERILKELDL